MTFHRLLTSVLALAAAVVPVSASTVYCVSACGTNDPTAFTNATTGLLFPNAPISFAFGGLVLPDQTDYIDSSSTVNFFDYKNGTTLDSSVGFSVPATALKASGGDLIQVALPAGVLAFGFDFSQSNSNASFCVEAQSNFDPNACAPSSFFPGTGTQFIGLVSSTPISTIWIGPITGTGTTQLNDFEIGEQGQVLPPADTPEIATFLMIGIGLISLRFLPRKLRPAV